MLAIKNLVDAGVKNIVNFYRSDFVFESQTAAGWYRCVGTATFLHQIVGTGPLKCYYLFLVS